MLATNRVPQHCRTQAGFALIEMLVVVAMVGVLITAASASYQSYLKSAALKNAGLLLLKDAEFMEKYYTQKGSYASAGVWPELPYPLAPETGPSLYRIKLLPSLPDDVNRYSLVATPLCDTIVASEGCICADQDSNLNFGQNAACNNAGGICPCVN